MSAPRVSIVCPSYNATGTIRATIRSVLAQTFEDFELIVVDDGSSDDTPEIVAGFAAEDPRVKLIVQENAGTAGARNRGIQESSGEMIAIIDNDDLWLPRYLEAVTAALERTPSAGLCHTDAWILDDRNGRVHRKTAVEWPPPRPSTMDAARLRSELLRGNFIMASSVTMTRPALEAAGEFDTSPGVRGSDDWDLWLRIAEAGFGAVRPAGVLAVYRERPDSVSRNHVLMMKSANAVATAALQRDSSDPQSTAAARKLIEHTGREIATGTSASPFVKLHLRIRRRVGAWVRRILRPRNWWAPPAPLRALLDDVEPGRWQRHS